ncbi:hypothetical protein [Streptomyces sp. H27-C3]|uniref:hypothetical protein n=1 Tax=Streptomyces sp. H27-C3 TaxID=3046305 RepID=UPI0024BA9582|nr:hypothetical protein [Streptomyces sp. H27-C3]MDJ0464641.1 hypothetical protein [Streptomyces sp. H27-C3]
MNDAMAGQGADSGAQGFAEGRDTPGAAPREPAGSPAADGTAAGPGVAPAGPAPIGVARTPTGRAEVDAHLERLADADHLPSDGHIEVYEDVHGGLRDALTALDARPGPPAPPSPYENRS